MKGRILRHSGEQEPNSYIIQGEDGNQYFAHVSDLEKNEEILYNTQHEILNDGDEVEFEIPNAVRPHVFHVKRAN